MAAVFPRQSLSSGIVVAGAICSVIPDLDVIGFKFGIEYGDLLGHRGLTHSILFAAVLGGALTVFMAERQARSRLPVFLFLFLSTLSHPLLDAMTSGGLGVALFAPFQNDRYFFPWRPIRVSPIGVGSFISARGLLVLWSELLWVWIPSALLYSAAHFFKSRKV